MKYAAIIAGLYGLDRSPAIRALPDCAPVPLSFPAPIADPTSAPSFENDPLYAQVATQAAAPAGYSTAFVNAEGAYMDTETYLTYKNLDSYSPETCASFCASTPTCSAFNIYFLRLPTLVPGPACPDPPAGTVYRCAIYSGSINFAGVQNYQQVREKPNLNLGSALFETAIEGSNGMFCRIVLLLQAHLRAWATGGNFADDSPRLQPQSERHRLHGHRSRYRDRYHDRHCDADQAQGLRFPTHSQLMPMPLSLLGYAKLCTSYAVQTACYLGRTAGLVKPRTMDGFLCILSIYTLDSRDGITRRSKIISRRMGVFPQ
jgi:hypothetical protein